MELERNAKWIWFCLSSLPFPWFSLLLGDATMSTAGVISLRASLSDPVLLLIRFVISIQLVIYLLGFCFDSNREKCLMGSDSGKGRLMKTGERRASGILTFTLVIFLLVFWIFSYNHTLYQMLLFFFENY